MGGFGAAPTPAFGTPAPAAGGFGGFGAAAPAPAQGGFGGFGAAPTPGLFGGAPAAAAPAGGLFGAAPAPAPAGGLFGSTAPAPAQGSLFGAPAPAAAGGLFGSPAPAPAGGLFGAPQPAAAPGLFGAPAAQPAGGGLFGAPATAPAQGGLFGAPAAPAPAGGLFGAPAPVGGMFGAPAAPAGGSFFGAGAPTAPAPGGLFGAPAPVQGGGLFGAPAPQPGGGLFGATPAAPVPSAYGAMMPGGAPMMHMNPNTSAPPSTDALLSQQLAALENQKKELASLEFWRGSSPGGSSVIPTSLSEQQNATKNNSLDSFWARSGKSPATSGRSRAIHGGGGMPPYAISSASMSLYQAAPRSAAKIAPRGFGSSSATKPRTPSTGLGMGRNMGPPSPILSPDSFLGSSTKKLVIKPGALTPKPKMRLLLTNHSNNESSSTPAAATTNNGGSASMDQRIRQPSPSMVDTTSSALTSSASPNGFTSPSPLATTTNNGNAPSPVQTPKSHDGTQTLASKHESSTKTPSTTGNSNSTYAYEFYRQVVGSPENGTTESPAVTKNRNGSSASISMGEGDSKSVPKLTKGGYSLTPSLDKLREMSEADLAAVSGFVVMREGYGSVAWDGAVDVRGIDLDAVVTIEARDVAVYDAAELSGTKPPVGSKLNRPAVLTMYNIFPKEGPSAPTEAKEKLKRKITRATTKMGAEFLSFDFDTGVWKFRVAHFSRYKLDDSDDEEEEEEDRSRKVSNENETMSPESHLNAESSPVIGGRSRMRFDDDTMSETSMGLTSEASASLVGVTDSSVMEAAEDAYMNILEDEMMALPSSLERGSELIDSDSRMVEKDSADDDLFVDE
eukprot:scaffold27975_cov43-Attheya_sp.AAC.1